MASRTLDVKINATDGASATFKKVGDSAKTMGDTIDGAGDDFDTLNQKSGDVGLSFDGLITKGTLVAGAVIGIGAAFKNFANAASDHERNLNSIERAYGTLSDAVQDDLEEIVENSPFTGADVLGAERYFVTLHDAYGLSLQDLQSLRQLTADAAADVGISYEQAASRITSAIRGETEAAEFLGFTLNQQSIDREGLTLTMTNQEAAQFRLNAALEQGTRFQGAAQEQADGITGSFGDLSQATNELKIAVGNLVDGPLALAVGVLADVFNAAGLAAEGVDFFLDAMGGSDAAATYQEGVDGINALEEALRGLGREGTARDLDNTTDRIDRVLNTLDRIDTTELAEKFDLDPSQFSGQLTDEFATAIEEIPELQNRLVQVINNPDIDASAYLSAIDELFSRVAITAEGSNVNEIIDQALALDPDQFRTDIAGIAQGYDTFFDSVTQMAVQSERQQQAVTQETERQRAASIQRRIELEENALDAQLEINDRLARQQQEIIDEAQARREEFIASGLALAGADDFLGQINATEFATDMSLVAESVGIANEALSNTFRIVVENTEAIGGSTQAVEDWIVALNTATEEGMTPLQEVLEAGLITTTEYNAAQQAQQDILQANAETQAYITSIQAQQAPLLADLTEQQAAYLAVLAEQPAQQQLIALGWADANTAAQANEAIMLAATVANEQWGAVGVEATQRFIEGAIAANPVLEELLTDIGLVARDHQGNLVIDFSQATSAKASLDDLLSSIDALALSALGIPPISIDDSQVVLANGHVIELDNAHAGLDGQTSTININANDSARSAVNYYLGLNGAVLATSYVNVVEQRFGAGTGVATPFAHGGIPSFASGGMVPFWAGENGLEVAHFATGGTALLPHEGMYAAPPMTYISPNNAVSNSYGGNSYTININGPVYGIDDLTEQVAARVWQVEVEERIAQRIGAGVMP